MVKYIICYTCRLIWCTAKECNSPSNLCNNTCRAAVNEDNVYYDFCGACQQMMTVQFEKQMRKKLRTEE